MMWAFRSRAESFYHRSSASLAESERQVPLVPGIGAVCTLPNDTCIQHKGRPALDSRVQGPFFACYDYRNCVDRFLQRRRMRMLCLVMILCFVLFPQGVNGRGYVAIRNSQAARLRADAGSRINEAVEGRRLHMTGCPINREEAQGSFPPLRAPLEI